MPDLNTTLQLLTLLLLAAGGYWLQAVAKTTAEEAAKDAIQRLKWSGELARELQKTRGIERQELRFKCYGALWKELRPLAIYDTTVIDKTVASDLSAKLSDWYFSDCGGLLLTPQARDFYFALQDLLRATSKLEDWETDKHEDSSDVSERPVFQSVLKENSADGAIEAMKYLSAAVPEDWQDKAADHAKNWREGINRVAKAWNKLNKRQRFATLQQVGSILRTSLVNDLESRAR
ncbi:hypothetical protein [Bradyrhizobium sp.]|jgi:hypothetical protein|uniref:hypothetical protein n=1 Tax=Bradyrhizobium sp. TaxID=376 RepID=UPI002C783594|nr:hypothetical protein [Bradyrhizobium sp.]HWX58807.1 hypothetical protein [Bradyrhizobium sp.]